MVQQSSETKRPDWISNTLVLAPFSKWIINNSFESTQYVIQSHLLLIHFNPCVKNLGITTSLSAETPSSAAFQDIGGPWRDKAAKISPLKWSRKKNGPLSAGGEALQGLAGLVWPRPSSQPLPPPALPRPLNSRLPSSESICYQIKRRASDSLLFSAAADLYAECKTDALCDTYLWWAPLSQDLLQLPSTGCVRAALWWLVFPLSCQCQTH